MMNSSQGEVCCSEMMVDVGRISHNKTLEGGKADIKA